MAEVSVATLDITAAVKIINTLLNLTAEVYALREQNAQLSALIQVQVDDDGDE